MYVNSNLIKSNNNNKNWSKDSYAVKISEKFIFARSQRIS